MAEMAAAARAGENLPPDTVSRPGVPSASEELIGTALQAALEQRFDCGLLPPSEPQAIVHPNGFVKLPLARTGDGRTRLFLHVWRAESVDADIHDHRWSYTSAVLRGELSHTVMDVTVTSDLAVIEEETGSFMGSFLVARYYTDSNSHRFDTTHHERAVVNGRRTYVVSTAQRYEMEAFVFHRAHALAGAMTFVARGLPQRPCARVLVDEAMPPPVAQRWSRLDTAERRWHLRDALQALG
ncbi:hypothetical protein AB0G86_01045 [Streptomyces scabiei]|uniref:hypothetical protein n=1 Tax=Streptomyces scabiei TaxID=1930 RepID=UPI0033F525DA